MQKVPPDACRISARPGKGEKTAAVKSSRISFQTDEKKFREGEEHPAGTAAPDRAVCLMRVDPAYFALRARAPLRQNPSASGGFLSRRAVTVFALPMAKTLTAGGVAPCAAETTPPKAVMRGKERKLFLCLNPYPSPLATPFSAVHEPQRGEVGVCPRSSVIPNAERGGAEESPRKGWGVKNGEIPRGS